MGSKNGQPSRPEDFRKTINQLLRTGPVHGMTVRIRPLDPKDFLELGMMPGLVDILVENLDPEDRKKAVEKVVEEDKVLELRMIERMLTSGITDPKVVVTLEEVKDPKTTVTIKELGADAGYFLDEILILSGLRGRRRWSPFRRLMGRLFAGRYGARVVGPSE